MATSATAVPASGADVMASIDDEGPEERLVIADVSRDDAWVTIDARDAAPLAEWR
ncbi:hypothetical protein U3A55_10870 [Salarchaeum sp. III]|uniref:DUF7556 family protein n=1 Tax=Salarchaeum sp. III TaxID=3107927 RepID=UPI002ED82857